MAIIVIRTRCNSHRADQIQPDMANRPLAERARRSTDLLALVAFCAFLFFAGLQVIGLLGADEPRYAQVAREMLERHDWVTPTLWGQPWLEKPPLLYWGQMLAYKATGRRHRRGCAIAIGGAGHADGVLHLRRGRGAFDAACNSMRRSLRPRRRLSSALVAAPAPTCRSRPRSPSPC